jgi:transposase
MKARIQAANQIRAMIDTASDELQAEFRDASTAQACAQLVRQRTRDESRLNAVTRKTLIRLAKRWTALNAEIKDYDQDLTDLVTATAPALLTLPAVGVDTAGALLVSVGDNPDRLESEAIFAALCGVAPLPASSGRTQRHRLNRGPAPSSRRSNSPDKYVSSPPRSASPRSRSYRHPFTCRVCTRGALAGDGGSGAHGIRRRSEGTNHRVSSEGDGTR